MGMYIYHLRRGEAELSISTILGEAKPSYVYLQLVWIVIQSNFVMLWLKMKITLGMQFRRNLEFFRRIDDILQTLCIISQYNEILLTSD